MLKLDLSPDALNDRAQADELDDAVRMVTLNYGDQAGSEVLNRALFAERSGDRVHARFWCLVYREVSSPA